MKEYFELAVRNVAHFGDTDIFPFPLENAICFDLPERVVALLQDVHADFDRHLDTHPPINLHSLAPAGYSGFRWATQIDPLWNAYFLGLVASCGPAIESARIAVSESTVFSYRYSPTPEGHLFLPSSGWPQFREQSVGLAKDFDYVLVCDISDFYTRIYHHRLENALRQIVHPDAYNRIMRLLAHFSGNVSYGLPIGGPAARLLAELLLNRTDRLFRADGLVFCRFADDYHFFAKTQEEAYRTLVNVSEKLYANEGLSLQKTKTRIMRTTEFLASHKLMDDPDDPSERASLLKLSLRFDPYSANAKADYAHLSEAVGKFDILGLLSQELAKTRVHSPLTKKLIQAIHFLKSRPRNDAVLTLLGNLSVLSPLYGVVSITIKELFTDLEPATHDHVLKTVYQLIRSDSHITQVDLHLAYSIRLLGLRHTDEHEALINQLFRQSQSPLIRKECILCMTRWRTTHWLSDKKRHFETMSSWERRAFLVASYVLGDEGKHWRDYVRDRLRPFELLVRDWSAASANKLAAGVLPL